MRRMLWVILMVLMIPYSVTLAGTHDGRQVIAVREQYEIAMSVEEYLVHVLAAQIPVNMGPETLKAQAVLARTYIYGLMDGRTEIYEEELDMDTMTIGQMKQTWGEAEFGACFGRLEQAVKETAGLYLLYDGVPIEPLFCYMSAGMTRSMGEEFPYLKQTPSPWDREAEEYRSLPVFSQKEFAERISGITWNVPVDAAQLPEEIQIVERDGAGYVKQVQIGQKTYSGEDVQYALGLPSSCYSFEDCGDSIRVICKGIGHGYGFSQFGASEQEKEGKTYEELLTYYYQNVDLVGKPEPAEESESKGKAEPAGERDETKNTAGDRFRVITGSAFSITGRAPYKTD